ncbi:MAG: polysaccharide pyruvyl transferase family protein [Bryobacteraceae bacterium]
MKERLDRCRNAFSTRVGKTTFVTMTKHSKWNRSAMASDPTRKKLALFGMFGVGNLGNECTLQTMLHNLRRFLPNAEVCCSCADPSDTASRYGIPACKIREMSLPPINNRPLRLLRRIVVGIPIESYRWLKVIRRLAGVQLLIMTGTGMLSDLDISPFGLHYDIIRWSIVAKLCRCKVMFVSVGVGPIRHPLSRFLVKMALRMADYRSYRDTFSKSYVEAMGISTVGDAVYPDLAFSLPEGMLPHARSRHGRAPVIGIGLITNDKRRATLEKVEAIYDDYIKKLGAFVVWLIEHKYTVQLIIGDVTYDSRARQDLIAFLERSGLKYDSGQLIHGCASSVSELLSQLAGTDIVVASRFHNVLLALLLGKPVVAISFHEKVDSLMNAMGLTQFCQDIEHVDVDKLIHQLTTLEENSESIKREVSRQSEVWRRALEDQYEALFKVNPLTGRSLVD